MVLAASAAAALLLGTSGCSATGADPDSCTAPIVHRDAPRVTVWGWWNAMGDVVEQFNQAHDNVQVCWTNVGQSADEYPKLRTAFAAQTGAPDIVMIENEQLNSFAVNGSILDLAPYGVSEAKAEFTEGAWQNVSVGDRVLAVPVDGGPVGLYYRADLLAKAGIDAPPKTWEEYAEQAEQYRKTVKDGTYGNFSANTPSLALSLFQQAGNTAFSYDAKDPNALRISLDDKATRKVTTYWHDLIEKGAVDHVDAFTTDNSTMLASGLQATYIGASWGTGVLAGLADAGSGADWRVAPLPQWDTDNPVSVQWGGSSLAVTKQAADPKLATRVALELYGSEKAMDTEIAAGDLFPTRLDKLNDSAYADKAWPFFGGQKIVADVFAPAAAAFKGQTFSPFSGYLYPTVQEALTAVAQGKADPDKALAGLQSDVVNYVEQQGVTVR